MSVSVLAMLWVVACGDSTSGERASSASVEITRTDSAGVQIVEIPEEALAELPIRRIAATASMRIGAVSGDENQMLGRVADATLLPTGEIAIVDAQQDRVLVYDQEGDFQRSVGRRGEGPGEFGGPARITSRGDSLFVADLNRSRVQTFNADGTFLSAVRISGGPGLQMGLDWGRPTRTTLPYVKWNATDGFPGDAEPGEGPFGISMIPSVMDSTGGKVLDTLDAAPGHMVRLSSEARQRARDAGLSHFTVGTIIAHPAAPDWHAATLGDVVVLGWSGREEVEVHAFRGGLRRVIRFDLPDSAPASRETATPVWLAGFVDPDEDAPITRDAVAQLEWPDSTARFFDLRAGARDALWIAVSAEPGAYSEVPGTRWLGMTLRGEPVGWLVTPPVQLLEIGWNYVIARLKDELAVEYVARFDLAEPGD